MDPNEALSSLGDPWKNPWQMIIYNLIFSTMGILVSWQMLAVVFIGATPDHYCRLPIGVLMNESIPYQDIDGERHYDRCLVYENFSSATNRTVPCPLGWQYEYDSFTITEQWDLVCDKNYWTETTQTVLGLGVLVGAITMTAVADKFGRKRTVLMCACASSFVLFLTALANNYYLFTALRFLLGIFLQGTIISGFVLACELFPAKHRAMAGMIGLQYWMVGMVLLSGIAYVTRNWRHLLIVTSLPGLLMVPLFWVIPESIPWLIAKNRIEEAKEILQTAAKRTKLQVPEEYRTGTRNINSTVYVKKSSDEHILKMSRPLVTKKRKRESHTQEYTVLDILMSATLRIYVLVMFYLWFVVCLVYYGLTLSSGTLAGNRYINFGISGLIEVPANLLFALLLKRFGRRWPMCVFLITAGLSLFMTLIIPQTTASGADLSMLPVIFNMIGKFSISAVFGGIYVYTPELFPTTLRNIGIGMASVGGRVGNLIAPYSTYFIRLAPWFPGVVLGSLSLFGGVVTLLLPETRGRPLPQTIEEVEHWSQRMATSEEPELDVCVDDEENMA